MIDDKWVNDTVILLTFHGATKGKSGYSFINIVANKTHCMVVAAKGCESELLQRNWYTEAF